MLRRVPFHFIIPLILLILCFINYSNSINNEPILDDYSLIIENTKLLNLQNFLDLLIPQRGKEHHYRPLVDIVLAVLHPFFGNHSSFYHLTIMLLYFIYCLLFYKAGPLMVEDKSVALLAVLLFAVHPINVIAGGYLTGGFTCLYGIFMMLSLLAYVRWLRTQRITDMVISLFFYLLAFLCYEIALFLPLYLICVSLCFSHGNKKEALSSVIPYIVLAFVYLVIRLFVASVAVSVFKPMLSSGATVFQILATCLILILWYVSRLFYPVDITFIYSIPIVQNYAEQPQRQLLFGGKLLARRGK